MLRRLSVMGLALVLACGGPAAEQVAPGSASGGVLAERAAASAAATRQRTFATVARIDRRLARRVGLKPQGVELLFPENRAPAELAALLDFPARERVLREQRSLVERQGDRVLVRFLDEELARVDEERDLPRSASAIVRTIALELPVDDTREEDVRSEDEALVATLDRLRGALADGALGPLQLAELDDALDLFEKRTTRLAATPGAIARLRVTLTSLKSAPAEVLPPSKWQNTLRQLAIFAGPLPSAFEADGALDAAHAALGAALAPLMPRDREGRERLASAATGLLLSSGTGCADADLPEVQAPIERRGLCVLLGALAKNDPVALLAADLALDLARFTVLVHRPRADVAAAFANKHSRVPLDEVDGAHAFRFALVHPVEAITLGWCGLLIAANPAKMASAWLAHGPMRPDEARSVLGPSLM